LSLEGLDVVVTRASDALDSATTLQPDLIVIDADVGEAVSAEVTGGLRQTPQTESTPIVLLTEEQYREGPTHLGPVAQGAGPSATWEPYLLRGLRIVPVRRRETVTAAAARVESDRCEPEALVLTLVSAALLVDSRMADTAPHLERVARLAVAVHEAHTDLASGRWDLVVGAFLHDLGKVALRPGILDQQAPLRLKDWFRIYTHPLETMALLVPVPFLRAAIPACRSLHERWDGNGYPDGVAGYSIPPSARLIGVCEAYDAMRVPRPWRPALSADDARDELRRGAGTRFDPEVVDAFLDIEPRVRRSAPPSWYLPHLRRLFDRLSPRPWQVLALCAGGIDVPTSSALLGIDRDQVGNYRGRLRRQLRLPGAKTSVTPCGTTSTRCSFPRWQRSGHCWCASG
jgi:HD-GYP domain-containing protein (c-di-GMP phosphodiesterase class II)